MTPTNRVQVPIYLSPDLLAELDQLAEQRETTRQILLREAVEDYLGYRWVRERVDGRPTHLRRKVAPPAYPSRRNIVAGQAKATKLKKK